MFYFARFCSDGGPSVVGERLQTGVFSCMAAVAALVDSHFWKKHNITYPGHSNYLYITIAISISITKNCI